MVGLRYLRARRREAFVSLIALIAGLGVAIGVMTLCIVMAVMTGFEEDLRERILGFNPQIVLLSHAGTVREADAIEDSVPATPGVARAAPFVYGQAMVSSPGAVGGAVVRGVEPDKLDAVVEVRRRLLPGSHDTLGQPMPVRVLIDGKEETVDAPQILLGFELAKTLGVKVGDWVNVMSPMGSATAVGFTPRIKRFAVGGLFDSGMYDYDSTILYMSLADAQRFFELDGAVTGIEVRLNDLYAARRVADDIENRVGYPYYARDWMEVNRNLFTAFRLEKFIQFVVLC